jgi:hypothetical protein
MRERREDERRGEKREDEEEVKGREDKIREEEGEEKRRGSERYCSWGWRDRKKSPVSKVPRQCLLVLPVEVMRIVTCTCC